MQELFCLNGLQSNYITWTDFLGYTWDTVNMAVEAPPAPKRQQWKHSEVFLLWNEAEKHALIMLAKYKYIS